MRVLKLPRAPYYRWLHHQVAFTEIAEVNRANALLDAHQDDPEFGHRPLRDEEAKVGKSCASASRGGSAAITAGV